MTNPASGGFQFSPATGLNDIATFPTTPINEVAARQQFMELFWQLMNEMNTPTASAAANAQYNKLINGNFGVWQRGTSFTNPGNTVYTADRWQARIALAGILPASIIHSKQALTPGDIAGASDFYRIAPDGAGSGFGANDEYRLEQGIENGTRYLCGAGKKVTVSFWARSNIPGKKIGTMLVQFYGSGGTPSAADTPSGGTNWTLTPTWTKYTVTFATNSLVGKTFGTNNNDSLNVRLYAMWGSSTSTNVGATVAETFVGAGNIDIAQVQVNAGELALPFQPRSAAEELVLCQRYFEIIDFSGGQPAISNGTANAYSAVRYSKKRTIPTCTVQIVSTTGQLRWDTRGVTSETVTSGVGTPTLDCCEIYTNSATAARNFVFGRMLVDAEL